MFATTTLTPREMTKMDDGQGWWKKGDEVAIGCSLPDDTDENPAVQLEVNGESQDNWTFWLDLPQQIQARLLAAPAVDDSAHY